VSDYPDVGFAYWATFAFRCEFPESLNCSIGIGLEAALGRVIVVGIILFFLTAYLFPAALPALTFILFVVAVPAVAWHYSPQCWFMTPSFPLGGGLSVPIWPVPIAFPALPECIMDEFVALADKYITDCYSGPGSPNMIIPEYLINGELCPASLDQHIDVINCKDVGVSDGIQNLLFLGVWTLGSGFCDFALQIVSTCIGSWWPGLEDYMRATLESFKDVTDTQMQRQVFCFWATIPTILLPLVLAFVVFTFFGFIIPAIIELIISVFELFAASPAVAGLPGYGQEWFELSMDEAGDERVYLNPDDGGGGAPLDEFGGGDDDVLGAQAYEQAYTLADQRARQRRVGRRRRPATLHQRSGLDQARNWMGATLGDWFFPRRKHKKE